MQEKTMVADALNAINGSITKVSEMISQTENQQLRMKLQQIRNETETSQYELFNLAKSKGYYTPAEKSTESEIQTVKSVVTSMGGSSVNTNKSGTTGQFM
ncbi:spore coat protein [Anaeromicropila populeti]|uniref:Coat F domain-containing protein n=1 Tax=Anaeromicropila populeti TaxID=37658 RepID=A0A1I6ILZ5_9FIRM|nr:spore coat protein [Anaeromicropila populeti]SFR67300.1 Coat F domain-containing protein [Anaeromicropila populeti]